MFGPPVGLATARVRLVAAVTRHAARPITPAYGDKNFFAHQKRVKQGGCSTRVGPDWLNKGTPTTRQSTRQKIRECHEAQVLVGPLLILGSFGSLFVGHASGESNRSKVGMEDPLPKGRAVVTPLVGVVVADAVVVGDVEEDP